MRKEFIMNQLSEKGFTTNDSHLNDPFHIIRQRINAILNEATTKPVTIVRAGTGCGKTRAVSDFLRQTIQENIIAFDDLHFSIKPEVHTHLDKLITDNDCDTKLVLIYRDIPDALRRQIDTLMARNMVSVVTETALNFTQAELATCLKRQGLRIDSQIMSDIYKDTGGWAFAVSLAARSLKRVPKYPGFVKSRLKPNIFQIMESEKWDDISDKLKRFLISLSLIDNLYIELVYILAGGDEELLSELKKQTAFIRFDNQKDIIFIHDLYLDFLRSKQDILEADERIGFYKIAAYWCSEHNFKKDASSYLEKAEPK
jgi:LuxR family maltose regulon positive regulatory protein